MTSDRQRREVAARLRACAQDVNGTRDFAMYLSNWVGVEGVADDEGNQFSVAADRWIAERTLEKLADLIDRPTCRDVGNGDCFICSECGCSVTIVDLYSEPVIVVDGVAETPRFCPCCGAEVIDDSE